MFMLDISELDFNLSASSGVNSIVFFSLVMYTSVIAVVIQLGVSLDVQLGIRNCSPCEVFTDPISQDGNVHLVYMLNRYFSRKDLKHGNNCNGCFLPKVLEARLVLCQS